MLKKAYYKLKGLFVKKQITYEQKDNIEITKVKINKVTLKE